MIALDDSEKISINEVLEVLIDVRTLQVHVVSIHRVSNLLQ